MCVFVCVCVCVWKSREPQLAVRTPVVCGAVSPTHTSAVDGTRKNPDRTLSVVLKTPPSVVPGSASSGTDVIPDASVKYLTSVRVKWWWKWVVGGA
jgi:hypothetical protein